MLSSHFRIAIGEDQAPLRARLRQIIASQETWQLAWQADSLAQARVAIAGLVPELVILDIGLPDGSGLQLLPKLAAHSKVLIFAC